MSVTLDTSELSPHSHTHTPPLATLLLPYGFTAVPICSTSPVRGPARPISHHATHRCSLSFLRRPAPICRSRTPRSALSPALGLCAARARVLDRPVSGAMTAPVPVPVAPRPLPALPIHTLCGPWGRRPECVRSRCHTVQRAAALGGNPRDGAPPPPGWALRSCHW